MTIASDNAARFATRRSTYWRRIETCARKRRYATWEEARQAGIAVWVESPRPTDANPATPYPCVIIGDPHYHIGHLRYDERAGLDVCRALGEA